MTEGQDERAEQPARAPPPRFDPTAGRPPPSTRLDWAAAALTVGLYLLFQLLFLEGPHPFDPARYFQTAVTFPDIGVDLFTLRVGVVAPVYAAVLAFGPSEAAFYAVPVASGMVLVGAVYATMLTLFRDRVIAAVAGLVTGLNVHYLVNSSHIFPDIVLPATFTAAVLCLLLAGGRLEHSDGSDRRATILVAFAGILLAWCYLAREFSPILLPVVVGLVIVLRFPRRQIAILALAAFATFLIEPLYGLVGRGEPFVRWRLLLSRGEEVRRDNAQRVTFITEQLDGLSDSLVVLPRLLLAWSTGWAFLVLAGLFLVTVALLRDRRLWLLFVWFSCVFGLMSVVGLMTLSSGEWVLNVTNIRYWYVIFPPVVMGAFGGLWLFARAWFPGPRGVGIARGAALALGAVVLVPGAVELHACTQKEPWRNDPIERWHELRSWFTSPAAARFDAVYTDWNSWRLLPAYTASRFGGTRWDGEVETLEPTGGFAPTHDAQGALLLVHKDRWGASAEVRRRWEELSDDWLPIFVSGDQRMVVLAHESALDGEPLPAAAGWWRTSSAGGEMVRRGTCGVSPYEPSG